MHYLNRSLRRPAHAVVVHDVVLQLVRHLRVAALVLADVRQRLGPAQDPVVQSGKYITLKRKPKRNEINDTQNSDSSVFAFRRRATTRKALQREKVRQRSE